MTPLHPSAGLRVGGRYLLTEPIAGGGMGEVWRARDEVLGRVVAVKLLRREYAADDAFLGRFRAEARHAASLSHPGIAQVFDYGEDDGTAYLVMEFVPGEPLSARLAREGALPAAVAVPLLRQAASALDAAHATGLVHRDVKPGNLLITPDERVKITDFGIARAGDQAPLTRTGEVMGTAQYLSPEQAMGRTATPASDVYSLGIVAYEMLAGRRPFDADTAVAIALAQVNNAPDPLPATVAAPVGAVVLQALAKDAVQRPASAGAFAVALEDALAGRTPLTAAQAATAAATGLLPPVGGAALPPVALPLEPGPTAGTGAAGGAPVEEPPRRRSRGALALALVLLLALGTAVAVALTRGSGTPDPQLTTPVTTPATTQPTSGLSTTRRATRSRSSSSTSTSTPSSRTSSSPTSSATSTLPTTSATTSPSSGPSASVPAPSRTRTGTPSSTVPTSSGSGAGAPGSASPTGVAATGTPDATVGAPATSAPAANGDTGAQSNNASAPASAEPVAEVVRRSGGRFAGR